MKVIFDHFEDLAPTIKTLWFKPSEKFDYIAGQFIEMYLPNIEPDERGNKHWFTLSSSPTEKMISITTRFFDERRSNFKQALSDLKPGDSLNISEPMGDFVLPKDKNRPLLFVAGGIGLTPMRSMVKWLTDTSEKRDITMLYAAGRPEEFVFTDLFNDYGVKLTRIIKEPTPGWNGATGLLTPELILEQSSAESLIYISGPEPMTEALVEGLQKHGIHDRRLVTDYFPGYSW